MKISHIEHLGIAVKSLEEAIPFWENILGFKCYSIEEVADQKVKTAFFKVGQTKIELLEPTSEGEHHRQVYRQPGRGSASCGVCGGKHRGGACRGRKQRRTPYRQDAAPRGRGADDSLSASQVYRRCPDGALRGQEREMIPQHVTAPPQSQGAVLWRLSAGPCGCRR